MKILVDMDGVIADFESGFISHWKRLYPKKEFIRIQDRITHKIVDQYPASLKGTIEKIYQRPGFFKSLPPIPDGINSLQKMLEEGYDVFICSSPLDNFKNCVLEKYEWVEEKLGFDWTQRLILTKDKTLIRADFLIDDSPEVKGCLKPVWEHIIFDQPWNKNSTFRRLTWENWVQILSKSL